MALVWLVQLERKKLNSTSLEAVYFLENRSEAWRKIWCYESPEVGATFEREGCRQ